MSGAASMSTVYVVTEYVDRETNSPHGVFSTPELAEKYIKTKSAGVVKLIGHRTFQDARGAIWGIDQYTVDVLVPGNS